MKSQEHGPQISGELNSSGITVRCARETNFDVDGNHDAYHWPHGLQFQAHIAFGGNPNISNLTPFYNTTKAHINHLSHGCRFHFSYEQ